MKRAIRVRSKTKASFRHHSTALAAWRRIWTHRRMFSCNLARGLVPARQSHRKRWQRVVKLLRQPATAQLGATKCFSPSLFRHWKIIFTDHCQNLVGSWHCEINLDASRQSLFDSWQWFFCEMIPRFTITVDACCVFVCDRIGFYRFFVSEKSCWRKQDKVFWCRR